MFFELHLFGNGREVQDALRRTHRLIEVTVSALLVSALFHRRVL